MPSSDSFIDHLRRTSLGRALTAVAAGAALAACGVAYGQNAPAPEAGASGNEGPALQEVTVTAQFVRQSVQTTPFAITAINAASLADRGQTNLSQITNDVPSVSLFADEGAFGPSMGAYIRGIGQYDLDPALEPGVGIYVDNVYMGTLTGSLLDLLDLDRVEVLRGPQGTLEGMNSEGGAIKLFSKAPNGTPAVSVDALYGSRNHVELRGMANFTLVPDKLYVRISGVGNHQNGYVDVYDFGCSYPNGFTATDTTGATGTYSVTPGFVRFAHSCQTGQEGGTGYTAGRIYLRWIINDSMTNDLIGDLTNEDQEGPATTLLYAGPGLPNVPTPNPAGASAPEGAQVTLPATNGAQLPYNSALVPAMIPGSRYATFASFCMPAAPAFNEPAYCEQDRQQLQSWGASDTFNWTVNNALAVTNIVAQRSYFSSWAEDNDASAWPVGLGGDSVEHHQFSEELRFTGHFRKIMDYTFGGYYFRELSTYATHQDLYYPLPLIGAPPGAFDFIQDDPVLAHDRAGYLHTVWHLAPKLDLTLGARYTSQDKDYNYVRLNPEGGTGGSAAAVGALNGLVGTYYMNRWDYRVDLDYHFTQNFMAYGLVSTGFKGGGVNPRPFYAQQAVPFKPETLTNYELGLKTQWFQDHLRANLDGFFGQYRDIQTSLLDCAGIDGITMGSPCALPFNAGNAHEEGVEFETQGRWGGLEFDGSMSYLNFRYVSLLGYDPVTGVNLVSGITPGMVTPYTSRWQGHLGVQYSFPIGNVGALTARIDGNTRSGFYSDAVNSALNHVGGYTFYNAHLTYQPNAANWQVTLQALNFTDKFYYLNTFDLTQAGGASVAGTPAPPTEVDLEVKYTLH